MRELFELVELLELAELLELLELSDAAPTDIKLGDREIAAEAAVEAAEKLPNDDDFVSFVSFVTPRREEPLPPLPLPVLLLPLPEARRLFPPWRRGRTIIPMAKVETILVFSKKGNLVRRRGDRARRGQQLQ